MRCHHEAASGNNMGIFGPSGISMLLQVDSSRVCSFLNCLLGLGVKACRVRTFSLAVPSFYILGCFWMLGRKKQLFGSAVLHHFAQQHEDAFVTGAASLGHVVGN